MKYSTFKKTMERKGLIVTLADNGYLYVETNKATVGKISVREVGKLNTDFRSFSDFGGGFKRRLLQDFVELSMTPLDEREDEKRYRLRLPFITDHRAYLNGFRNGFFIGNKSNVNKHKTKIIFTESEIEELKRKHNLDSFVLEEVKEDE